MPRSMLLVGVAITGLAVGARSEIVCLDSPPDQDHMTKLANPSVSGFGSTVSFDGHFAAVGIPLSNKVEIYKREGRTWNLVQTLAASMGNFGSAVAISGDTLIVGNPNQDSAELFVCAPDGTWTSTVSLESLAPLGASPVFGAVVAIDGNRAVVGDRGDHRVYLFARVAGSWTFQDFAGVAGDSPQDVAIAGDLVCASEISEGLTRGVYTFTITPSQGALDLQADASVLKPNTGAAQTGYSLDLVGNHLVAGSPWAGTSTVAGQVDFFDRSGGAWTNH